MPSPEIPSRLGQSDPLLRATLFVGYPAQAPARMLIFYCRVISRIGDNIMAVAPKSSLARPNSTRFVLRPYRRIPIWRVLYYLSGDSVGKGVVTNLSQSGMRIQGEHGVKPGLCLALRLSLEEDGPTIEIELVTVRWVDGCDFGVDFIHISPASAKHIADAMNQQIRVRQMPR